MTVLAMDMPSECSTPQSGQSHVIFLPREILQQPGRMLESLAATRLRRLGAALRRLEEGDTSQISNCCVTTALKTKDN